MEGDGGQRQGESDEVRRPEITDQSASVSPTISDSFRGCGAAFGVKTACLRCDSGLDTTSLNAFQDLMSWPTGIRTCRKMFSIMFWYIMLSLLYSTIVCYRVQRAATRSGDCNGL